MNARIIENFDEELEIETEYVTGSFPVELIGLNSTLMPFTKIIDDRLLLFLGITKKYDISKLIECMDKMINFDKTNFFEKVLVILEGWSQTNMIRVLHRFLIQ